MGIAVMERDATHGGRTLAEGWRRVAFRAGEAAARAGRAEDTNPHPRGSSEAMNWDAGWRAAAAQDRS